MTCRTVKYMAVVAIVAAGAVHWARAQPAGRKPPPPPPPPPAVEGVDDPVERRPTTRPLPPLAAGERRVAVAFAGGHDTDPRDHGRPVVLVAAGLGVPAEVFRDTFTHVRPAGAGRGPTDAEARRNKDALLAGLSKYGVTNEQLDRVSNRYRYPPGHGGVWPHRSATAYAVVRGTAVVRFEVVDAGVAYSTAPSAAIDGLPNASVTVTLSFGTDLAVNGSIRSLTVDESARRKAVRPATRPN